MHAISKNVRSDSMTELIEKILLIADDTTNFKANLTILLNEYDITPKKTEVAIYDKDSYNHSLINKFLANKKIAGMTHKTIEYYGARLNYIFNEINKPINLITSDDIKVYLAKRQIKDKLSNKTLNNEWRVLSSFYNWAIRDEELSKNPMYQVDKVKERKTKKKALNDMECELIRNSCESLRDKALVEILFSTWCRVSEIEGMNISDIEDDQLTVTGKGEKERIVYLNSKAQLALKNYLEARTDNNDALFVGLKAPYNRLSKNGIENNIKKIGLKANVNNVYPHRFRRTGATIALRTGMSIDKVSHLLGHESIETTQVYIDIKDAELKEAHKKYVV